jgi:hypothetical protein
MTDTAQYLKELDAELARAGIRGARRKRIIAEFTDHLGCDPDAELGHPGAIPRPEAAVLARRAGVGLAAGAVAIAAFPMTQAYRAHPGAVAIGAQPTNWWWPLATAVGLVALVAAAPAVCSRTSGRCSPPRPGSAVVR